MNDVLQSYALYETEEPWENAYLLVLDFDEENIKGIFFSKKTLEMICTCLIRIPKTLKRVGYIHTPKENFKLTLVKVEKENK